MGSLRTGSIRLLDGSGEWTLGAGDDPVEIRIRDPRAYSTFLLRGTLGAADAYVEGWWSCDDLVRLFRSLTRDAEAMASLDRGVASWLTKAAAWTHGWRRNTLAGSRRNVEAHYDLSNEFFALFLDPTMAYSSGIFPFPGAPLEAASREKFERVCRELKLGPRDHVLEIGSGWGGFAIHAARQYGCRVTTTTISRNQFDFARRAVADAGLADRVDVLLQDYRQLDGQYDKIVSIEMIEAVGHEYLGAFFEVCAQRLRPHGAMLLQSITQPDDRYRAYRRSIDFIQKYVFPGGNVPSERALTAAIGRASDLRTLGRHPFGRDYAETMLRWRLNFWANVDQVQRLGFDDRFVRIWNYYLCYCEAGFLENQIDVVHLLLGKPECTLKRKEGTP